MDLCNGRVTVLTVSDHGQKELHLKEGSLSSNAKPQPAGKPMRIYMPSAMLEVLGTQFEVEARLSATMLNVSEGKVRVKRLSDGSTVDVPVTLQPASRFRVRGHIASTHEVYFGVTVSHAGGAGNCRGGIDSTSL